jgi:hypothetical protein
MLYYYWASMFFRIPVLEKLSLNIQKKNLFIYPAMIENKANPISVTLFKQLHYKIIFNPNKSSSKPYMQ